MVQPRDLNPHMQCFDFAQHDIRRNSIITGFDFAQPNNMSV